MKYTLYVAEQPGISLAVIWEKIFYFFSCDVISWETVRLFRGFFKLFFKKIIGFFLISVALYTV